MYKNRKDNIYYIVVFTAYVLTLPFILVGAAFLGTLKCLLPRRKHKDITNQVVLVIRTILRSLQFMLLSRFYR